MGISLTPLSSGEGRPGCARAATARRAGGAARRPARRRFARLQAARGRKIQIEMVLVLAEVRSPDGAVVAMKRRGNRTPIDEIGGVPDEEAGGVIEAGVGEVEVVADANGAAIGMVAAENRVAIFAR